MNKEKGLRKMIWDNRDLLYFSANVLLIVLCIIMTMNLLEIRHFSSLAEQCNETIICGLQNNTLTIPFPK